MSGDDLEILSYSKFHPEGEDLKFFVEVPSGDEKSLGHSVVGRLRINPSFFHIGVIFPLHNKGRQFNYELWACKRSQKVFLCAMAQVRSKPCVQESYEFIQL